MLNEVRLEGFLCRRPEVNTMPDGTEKIVFTLFVQHPYIADKYEYIDCVAWNASASAFAKHVDTERPVIIHGHLTSYIRNDGNKGISVNVRRWWNTDMRPGYMFPSRNTSENA